MKDNFSTKTVEVLAPMKTDAYKLGHPYLYAKTLERLYSTLTPRSNEYMPEASHIVAVGMEHYVQTQLVQDWEDTFFSRTWEGLEASLTHFHSQVFKTPYEETNITHLKQLHELGYLPVRIKALPEGTKTPMRVPYLTIENTIDGFAWVVGYLESTILSGIYPIATSATIANTFRQVGQVFANKSADNDGYLDYQFHDFSSRGHHTAHASEVIGLGHILNFVGSDTVQAMIAAQAYGANIEEDNILASVLATEHSIMQAGTKEKEFETYQRLIEENPNGILSIVSDTWDYWNVVNNFFPRLKEEIIARNGKVVIRPDSGNIIEIITGTLESLWDTFGGEVNSKGYKVLHPSVGLLYGEGVNLKNIKDIFTAILQAGFSAENVVFGVGAYNYSYQNTRDSFGHAVKTTSVVDNGQEIHTYKDPKTDTSHMKKSNVGHVAIVEVNGELQVRDGLHSHTKVDNDLLEVIFEDGKRTRFTNFLDIREKLVNSVK